VSFVPVLIFITGFHVVKSGP